MKSGDHLSPGISTTYLQDDFSTDEWEDHAWPNFRYEVTGGVGHLKESVAPGGGPYVSMVVNVMGADSPRLELDYRAKSDNYRYTNGYVLLYNPHLSQYLGLVELTSKSVGDTGWKHGVYDISDIIGDLSVVELRMYISSGWADDYHQNLWFDNVEIWGEPYVSGIPDVRFPRKGASIPIPLDNFVISDRKSDLTWSLYGDNHAHLNIDPASGAGTISGEEGWYGTETVAIMATDPDGRVGYDLIEVTVDPLQVPVQLCSSPAVSDLLVDGTRVPPTEQPKTVHWTEGTEHTLSVPETVDLGARRYVFEGWDDGVTDSSRTVTAEEGLSVQAVFALEYYLDASTLPPGIATIPQGGWHETAAEIHLKPPQIPRYAFDHWILDGESTTSRELQLTMDTPHEATAVYEQVVFSVTIASDPGLASVIIDGVEYAPESQPVTLDWNLGDSHTVAVKETEIESGLTRHEFQRWSDGSPTPTIIIEPDADMAVSAEYATFHYLDIRVDPEDLVEIGGSGWYREGESRTLTAPEVEGYGFLHWNLDDGYLGTRTLILEIDRPIQLAAEYQLIVNDVTLRSIPRVATLWIDGSRIDPDSQPASYEWLPNETHTISAEEIVGGSSTRYRFRKWMDGSTSLTRSIRAATDLVLEAIYDTEHTLGIDTTPSGLVEIEGSGWYREDTRVDLTAPNVPGYEFEAWTIGQERRNGNPLHITISEPKAVRAAYVRVSPDIQSPGDAEVEDIYNLAWGAIAGAELYQVEEDTNREFSSPRLVYEGTDTTTSTMHTQPATYYYRARARKDSDWCEWGPASSVAVSDGPGATQSGAWLMYGAIGILVMTVGVVGVKTLTSGNGLAGSHLGYVIVAGSIITLLLLLAWWMPSVNLTFARWEEAKVPREGMETVKVDNFGDFELFDSGLPSLPEPVILVNSPHGNHMIHQKSPVCYYDGVVKGKVLVFRWEDTDVDFVYVSYRVMGNQEFEAYRKD